MYYNKLDLLSSIDLILNLIIVSCEIRTLSKIKRKVDIIKYYTFLQNFIALIVSIVFSGYLIITLFTNSTMPEFLKGLRYAATCGLIATMFIYILFLSKNNKNLMSKNDFVSNFNPKKANFLLHYFCPIISLLSFIIFERKMSLTNSIWTSYVAIPSCLYCISYIILSKNNLWKEPYDLSLTKEKNNFVEILIMIFIPISFVLISYIIWNIK